MWKVLPFRVVVSALLFCLSSGLVFGQPKTSPSPQKSAKAPSRSEPKPPPGMKWADQGDDVKYAGSAFGGALLQEGETLLGCGAGFPEIFCEFNFADSRYFNLAGKLSIQYAMGFSLLGFNVFFTVPMRFGILQGSRLSFAIKVEPGAFIGGLYLDSYFWGFSLNPGALFTYQILDNLLVNFGIEIPTVLSFEPDYPGDALGTSVNLAIELRGGIEYRLNKTLALFAQIGIGPMLYFENFARRLSQGKDGVVVSGVARLTVGVIYRR